MCWCRSGGTKTSGVADTSFLFTDSRGWTCMACERIFYIMETHG